MLNVSKIEMSPKEKKRRSKIEKSTMRLDENQ